MKNIVGADTVLVVGRKMEWYRFIDGVWKSDGPRKMSGDLDDAVIIADIDVIKKEVTIPRTPAAEIPLLIATELKRTHYLEPETIVFDHSVSKETATERTVEVYAAKRAKIDEVLAKTAELVRAVRIFPRSLIAGKMSIERALNENGLLTFNFLPAALRARITADARTSMTARVLHIAAICLFTLASSLAIVSIAAAMEAHAARAKHRAMKNTAIDTAYAGYRDTAARYAQWKTALERSTVISDVIEKLADCPADITFTGIAVRTGKNGVVTVEVSGVTRREDGASAYVDAVNKGKYAEARLTSLEREGNGMMFRASFIIRKAGY